jgi:hypothetical protein
MYEYIFALVFLLNVNRPPTLIAPATDKAACMNMAGQFAVEYKDMLNDPQSRAQGAVPACLKIELPSV